MTVVERSQSSVVFDDDDDGVSPGTTVTVGCWPGVKFDTCLTLVEGASAGLADSEGDLIAPPEWAHLGEAAPDAFQGLRTDAYALAPLRTRGDVALAAAGLLAEQFVHEVMEWLTVDGQRVFNPHGSDAHWTPIGERLVDLFTEILTKWPDPNFDPNSTPEAP